MFPWGKTGSMAFKTGGNMIFTQNILIFKINIINPNPSIQKGVGYDQIDLTNKILLK